MSYDYMDKLDEQRPAKRFQVEVGAGDATEVIHLTDDEMEAVQFMDEAALSAQAVVNDTGDSEFYQVIDNEAFGKSCVVATCVVRPEPVARSVFNELFRVPSRKFLRIKKERA
jgi:hypothetical protein